MTELRLDERRGVRALEALVPPWLDLVARDPLATPFQRPEWLLPYCRAFGVTAPWAIGAWRGSRLAALLLLVLYEDGGRRVATQLGAGRSDWLDAIVDPSLAPEGAGPLLEGVAARAGGWDVLRLERLPADGWLARAGGARSLAVLEDQADDPCPVLELPAAAEGLAGVVPPLVRRSVRRGRRRLERAGVVEIVRASRTDVDRHVQALLALHAARWSLRGEPGVLAEAAVRRFHAEAAREMAAAGLLRGYRLVVGGEDAAVLHGFAQAGRAFLYLGGFAPGFRAASPGAVLLAHAVEEALRAGTRSVDLLRGREAYKYAWGAVDRPAVRRSLIVRTGRPVAAEGGDRAGA